MRPSTPEQQSRYRVYRLRTPAPLCRSALMRRMPRGLHGRAGPGRGPMMAERVWRLKPFRCHTAKYVRVSRSASRGAQATRRRMRALRIDRTATDGPRSAHAALPPTLGSESRPVVFDLAARLHDALRRVSSQDGPPGAPRRQPDPPRHAHRTALHRMRPADDVRAAWRYSPRLRVRHSAIRPPGVHGERRTGFGWIDDTRQRVSNARSRTIYGHTTTEKEPHMTGDQNRAAALRLVLATATDSLDALRVIIDDKKSGTAAGVASLANCWN
jgi:hypothetical protein